MFIKRLSLTIITLAAVSLNTACSSALFSPKIFKKTSYNTSHKQTSPIYGEPVRVSFSASAVQTLAGVRNTHAKIHQTVAYECKDEETIRYSAYLSVDECITDLMDQLIKSSNIQVLADYHAAPKTRVLAQNYNF